MPSQFGPTFVQDKTLGTATPQALGTAAAGASGYASHEDHVHPSEFVASSTYTPTLTQSGAVTKTVTYAHYMQVGKLILGWVNLAVTGAGSAGTRILMGLPAAAVTAHAAPIGFGEVDDASPSNLYRGLLYLDTTTTAALYVTDATTNGNAIGQSPSFALASGDTVTYSFMYEAA